MNPMQMLQNFIGKGMSPQQIINQMGNQNPMITNLIKMAESGNMKGVETFARNIFKEKGLDFDSEYAKFRNNFK